MTRIKGLILPLGLIVLWQAMASVFGIQSDTLAAPVDIVVALYNALGSSLFWQDAYDTIISCTVGLLVGGGSGLLVGVLFGLVPPISWLLRLPVEFLRPLPSIAIMPLALIIFGFGYSLEIAIVSFSCFFVVLILSEIAVHQVEPRLSEVSKMLGLGAFSHVQKIVLPAIFPRLFIAFRLAAGVALIVSITVEVAANPIGLGSRLMLAAMSLRPADMFATLFSIGFLGWVLNFGLLRLEHLLFPRLPEVER